jgi:dTDP-4-amino-4,6-dideoxygalactose transaminase
VAEVAPRTEREKEELLKVLESGKWGGYPSPNARAKEFNQKFAAAHDAKYGVVCANGTVSLEMCLRAGGLKYGDEVIVTPYTWIATASAVVTTNGVPVFADVKAEDYTIDPDIVEAKITEKTKAIIAVHLGSSAADMDRLMDIAAKHNLLVIEDCAHAHGGKWRGKGLGSIGHFGSFSFQSSKLMTSGEGGIVLTNDDEFNQKLHSLVNCGRKEPGYDQFKGWLVGGTTASANGRRRCSSRNWNRWRNALGCASRTPTTSASSLSASRVSPPSSAIRG